VVLRKPIPVLALVAVSVLAVVGASFYYVSRNGPPGSDHSQCSDPDLESDGEKSNCEPVERLRTNILVASFDCRPREHFFLAHWWESSFS